VFENAIGNYYKFMNNETLLESFIIF